MFNLISCFIHEAILRVGLGLVFAGLVGATQAAQLDEDLLEPNLNLLTTQFVHSGEKLLPRYQFSANIVITRIPDNDSVGLGFGSKPQMSPVVKPEQETAQTTSAHWQQAYGGDRISLQRLLRFEFKGERANITLRPRSVLIEGKQLKITFRPQSALIEKERLKILLQPHSASMSWSKTF